MGAQLATYFHTIVLNRCRTHLTRRREFGVEDETLQQLAEDQQRANASPDAELPRASATQLQHAMTTLRPRQRMALGMWAYADADVADIARALDIEVNAAHQLLHRAKLALRAVLSGVSP
jgi:RNA polymerase sigma-70 factor (ECF subfamily)